MLAKAPPGRLDARVDETRARPGFTWLRRPEVGAMRLRGRIGVTGAPFNLGEMSVIRCALKLATGEAGRACVQGRDKAHAERAALVDALIKTEPAGEIRITNLAALIAERVADRSPRPAKAATKVDFFTMVRGEDQCAKTFSPAVFPIRTCDHSTHSVQL